MLTKKGGYRMIRVLLRRLRLGGVLLAFIQLVICLTTPFQVHQVVMLWFQVGLCVIPATGFLPPMPPTPINLIWVICRESICWPIHVTRFLKRGNT